jgi:putative transposase
MAGKVYSEINLHIVWHTKLSTPLIKAEVETALYDFLRQQIAETPEVRLHAVGGTETHIHLAVTIPPALHIAEWIGKLKTGAAQHINDAANRKALAWQEGGGIVSFGTKDIKWVVRYIENQKELHAKNKTFERLEKIKTD